MTHLPREVSAEVATTTDMDRLEARLDRLESRLDEMQRFYVMTTVDSMTTLTPIFSTVVDFLG